MLWTWIQQNAESLAALGNLLMVAIWVVYLQLFYRQYRRQQRPQLVIHHAQGVTPKATCLLVNMSKEPVHVQCVMAGVETADGWRTLQVTDHKRITVEDPHAKQLLRQGPLNSGDFLLLGAFEDMLHGKGATEKSADDASGKQAAVAPAMLDGIRSIELRAVAIHGPTNQPIGARRRFLVEQHEGQICIRPKQLGTEQLARRRDRPQLNRWLRECFTPTSIH